MNITSGSLRTYFCDLWVFLPYLFLYLLWWIAGWNIESLTTIFQTIHLIHLGLFASMVWQFRGRILRFDNLGPVSFWLGVVLILLLPGAYFEYPSDAWEHFRRILRWQEGGEIGAYPADNRFKFSYFWAWSLFELVPIESRRKLLDYYSTFTQLLVLAQIFKVLSCVTQPAFARIGVLIFIGSFGTSIFGLRYYGLSSTLLAYAAYLQTIPVILKTKSVVRVISTVVFLILLIFFNHRQELLFLGLIVPIALCFRSWDHLPTRARSVAVKWTLSAIVGGFLLGPVGRQFVGIYKSAEWLSAYGGVAIWSPLYVNTLGMLGMLGLLTSALCLVFRRGNVLLSSFVMAPAFILVWPPTALILTLLLPNQYLTYRILYAFTAGLGILSLFELLWERVESSKFRVLIASSLLVLCAYASFSPQSPWLGRMWFAVYRPPVQREYNHLLPMVRWFADNWDLNKLRRCWLMSDDVTRTLLVGHFGVEEIFAGGDSVRRGLRLDAKYNVQTEGLVAAAQADQNLCGILVYRDANSTAIPESIVGKLSGHWRSENGDVRWLVDEKFIRAADKLVSLGWRREVLPLGYFLYTRPEIGISASLQVE